MPAPMSSAAFSLPGAYDYKFEKNNYFGANQYVQSADLRCFGGGALA